MEALTQETGSKEEKSEPEIAVEVVESVEEDDEEKDSAKKETDDWRG